MADKDDQDDAAGGIILAHKSPLRLGSLLIEPALRRVTDGQGREEFVEPRVMQVLVTLIEARGAILSRDDLVARCWDGRIVGDDAINRVLSRLRRLAEGIGAGSFTVETITKVGYRLVSADGKPLAADPAPAPSRGPKARRLWLGGAAGLLLVALALLLWPRLAAALVETPQVRLVQFDTLSPGLPAGHDLRSELLAAFGTDSTLDIITDDRAAGVGRHVYRLGGAIGGNARTLRFVTYLADEASGTRIWTNAIERPAAEAATAPRLVAGLASQIVRCTLSGIAEQKRALPVRVVSLYAAYCGEVWADDPNDDRIVDLARRVTEADPGFARGWSGLALVETVVLRDRSRPDWDAIQAEAQAAAARAEALDPRNGETYAAQALLLPITDFAGREALFRRSIEINPSDCGCEHQYFSMFLRGTGRLEEAAFEAKRSHDMEPLALASTWVYAEALYTAGHRREGDALLGEALTLRPDAPVLLDLDLRAALITRDYDRGLARASRMPGDGGRDAALLFGALKANAPEQALDRFRALAADRASNSRFVADGLAALGDDVVALEAAENLIDRTGSRAMLTFFDPPFAAARATPGFAAFAKRIGLLDYWRTTHRRPDFCRTARAPSVCTMI